MKIYVKKPGKRALRLIFPTILTSRLTMGLLKKVIHDSMEDKLEPNTLACIDQVNLKGYAGQIKAVKRMYPKLDIVDIEGSDGTVVKITL